MAAIPLACAAIAVPGGDGLVGFFVRKERKQHGLQRWVEGPVEPGAKVLVVEDTVTTGGSTVSAIERIRSEGLEIVATLVRRRPPRGRRRGDRRRGRRPVPGADDDRRRLPGPPGPLGHQPTGRVRSVRSDSSACRTSAGAFSFAFSAITAVTTAVPSRSSTITRRFCRTPVYAATPPPSTS